MAIEQVRFRNNFYKLTPDSGKLRSNVWIEQGPRSGELGKLAPWLEKATLKSMIWPRGPPPTTCSIDPLTGENYAHKYELSKVPAAGTPRILISGGDYDED